jgi:hypothetical protein
MRTGYLALTRVPKSVLGQVGDYDANKCCFPHKHGLRNRQVTFRSAIATTCVVFLVASFNSHVSAAVQALAYFRLGEDDPGATAGQPANTTTTDSVNASPLTLTQVSGGSPVYSGDVAETAQRQTGSTLAINLVGNAYYSGSNVITSLTDNFGIEGWFRPSVLPAGGFGGGGQTLAYAGHSGQNGFGLYIFGDELFGLYGGNQFLPTGRFASVDRWTYFALVRDGGITSLYVDNSTPIGLGGVSPSPASSGLNIGSNGGGEFFGGYADEVRLFAFAPGQFSPSDLLISVPEPSTYALAFAALACGGCRAWRRRNHDCRRKACSSILAGILVVIGMAITGSGNASAGTATWSSSGGGNDHAYELVGPGVYWNEAVSGAASRTPPDGYQQGQLASITSAAENDFLRAAFGEGSAWFGFTDEVVEGEWRWTDGSTGIWQDPKVFPSPIQTTYVNWITGEPNNSYDSGEDYAIIYLSYGGWNDGVGPDSGTKFLYLVEYSPVPVPEPSTVALALAGLTCTAWVASRRRGDR